MDHPLSLSIVRGHPTPEELAALTAVLLARLRRPPTEDGPARAPWSPTRPGRRPPVAWSRAQARP
ncbi:acyl-CoA carboxylase epsilon subunit [Streptomyces anandii]|uniref:acyl-CoA carboxylase epsilon subunit n=1 Tax=Streptomyces anandii TaxID=285454 RepID=UPI0036F9C17A